MSEFEGRDVVKQTLILVGTGDGLSKAMDVKPGEHHMGDSVDLLIRARVHKVRHEPTKDDDAELVRVEIMKAETITIVEAAFAEERIAAQREANDRAAAKAAIPFSKSVSNAADWSSDGYVVIDYGEGVERSMWPDDFDEGAPLPAVGDVIDGRTVHALLDHETGEPIVSPGVGGEGAGADPSEQPASSSPDGDDDWSDPPRPGLDIPTVDDLKFVDASVKDVALAVGTISDRNRLAMLRLAELQRFDGKGRAGVLKAIDARLTELGDI